MRYLNETLTWFTIAFLEIYPILGSNLLLFIAGMKLSLKMYRLNDGSGDKTSLDITLRVMSGYETKHREPKLLYLYYR